MFVFNVFLGWEGKAVYFSQNGNCVEESIKNSRWVNNAKKLPEMEGRRQEQHGHNSQWVGNFNFWTHLSLKSLHKFWPSTLFFWTVVYRRCQFKPKCFKIKGVTSIWGDLNEIKKRRRNFAHPDFLNQIKKLLFWKLRGVISLMHARRQTGLGIIKGFLFVFCCVVACDIIDWNLVCGWFVSILINALKLSSF